MFQQLIMPLKQKDVYIFPVRYSKGPEHPRNSLTLIYFANVCLG